MIISLRARFAPMETPMPDSKMKEKPLPREIDSGIDPDNSLLPMLLGGLVLIVLGAIVVMMFV